MFTAAHAFSSLIPPELSLRPWIEEIGASLVRPLCSRKGRDEPPPAICAASSRVPDAGHPGNKARGRFQPVFHSLFIQGPSAPCAFSRLLC